MKFLAKDFKKVITFINKMFTENEKENYSINLKTEDNVIYIVYENDNGLIFSKKISLIEKGIFNLNIKVRLSEFIKYNKFTKEVQVLELVLKNEDKLTGYIYDEQGVVITVFNVFEGIKYDMKSIYNEETSYEVNTNIFADSISNIHSITKTSYFKEADMNFNNIIDFIFNDKLNFFANNGIVLGYRRVNPITRNTSKTLVGQIDINDFKLLNKWLSVAITKNLKISFNDGYMLVNSYDIIISVPINITDSNLGIVHMYKKMTDILLKEEEVLQISLEDFKSKYNNKLLVQDTILNINNDLSKFKISRGVIKDNYAYPGNQIKNVINTIEEESCITICKNHNNPLIVKFADDFGCNIINKIKYKSQEND